MFDVGANQTERGRSLPRRDAKGMIDQRPAQKPTPMTSPDLDEARLRQQAIGQKLRQMFDEVVNEPVPDDFLEILRRADEAEKKGSGEQ
jgi:hypothetical protein